MACFWDISMASQKKYSWGQRRKRYEKREIAGEGGKKADPGRPKLGSRGRRRSQDQGRGGESASQLYGKEEKGMNSKNLKHPGLKPIHQVCRGQPEMWN